ncbi:hypothetical protein FRB99_001815 [Tulasnella sp. 403]|nr:hypothetical protein FRB99_001815 [Tulasnella sp. 403]
MGFDGVEIDMPEFKQVIDLDDIHVGQVRMKSSNAPLTSKSLSADSVNAVTSNHPITGTFAASKSARLVTHNSAINATIITGSDDLLDPSKVHAETSNKCGSDRRLFIPIETLFTPALNSRLNLQVTPYNSREDRTVAMPVGMEIHAKE